MQDKKLFIKNLAIVIIAIIVFIVIIKTSPVASLEDPGPGENEGSDYVPPPTPDPDPTPPPPDPIPDPDPISEPAEGTSNIQSSGSSSSRSSSRNTTTSSENTTTTPITTQTEEILSADLISDPSGIQEITVSETKEETSLTTIKNEPPIVDEKTIEKEKPNTTTETSQEEKDTGNESGSLNGEENTSTENSSSENNSGSFLDSNQTLKNEESVSENFSTILNVLPEPIRENVRTTGIVIKQTSEETAEIISSPVGQTVATAVVTAGAVSGASLSTSAILSSVDVVVVSDFSLGMIRFWGLLMTALGFKRRNKPWGSVYDSVTKQPIDPAYVKLLDMNDKEIASAITDIDGRYGFLVPKGTYKLVAHKTNYEFPSKKAAGKMIDEIYPDLYFGEIVEVKNDGEVINKNIPMDPIKFDWNEFEKKEKNLMKFYSRRSLVFTKVANALFILGLVLTLISAITAPKGYNIFFLIVYLVLYLARNTVIKPKSYGTIVERETGNPLSFAIIHIKNAEQTINRVASKIGKFYCLVPNGNYEITIDRKNEDESYTQVFREENFEVKKGFLNKRFEI